MEEVPFEKHYGEKEGEAEDRGGEDEGEEVVGFELRVGVLDGVADAADADAGGASEELACDGSDDCDAAGDADSGEERWHGVWEPQFEKDLRARGVVHEEEIDHVAVDADEALCGVGDDGGEADDEGDESDREEAGAHPDEDQGGDGDDGDGLEEDGVGVEHAADPGGLREDECDEEADDECGQEAPGSGCCGDSQGCHERGKAADDCMGDTGGRGEKVGRQGEDQMMDCQRRRRHPKIAAAERRVTPNFFICRYLLCWVRGFLSCRTCPLRVGRPLRGVYTLFCGDD